MANKSMHSVGHWTTVLNSITKEEGDSILKVLNWDQETRVSFRIAKKMYDEKFISEDTL